jgi:glycosyltransferase involved in cell wall biosynthesis
MILTLQSTTFSAHGGIPTYNRCVCRVLDEFAGADDQAVLIATDDLAALGLYSPKFKHITFEGFAGNRAAFIARIISLALRRRIHLALIGHVNYAPLGLVLRRIRPGLRYGVMVHGVDVWSKLPRLKRKALQQADFITSVSEYTKQRIVEMNGVDPGRVYILPNTIEWIENSLRSQSPILNPPKKINLLSVCRLDANEGYKGVDHVIEVLPDILKAVPNLEYSIVGGGSDLERHKQLAIDRGVGDQVSFLGSVAEEDLKLAYRNCDIFIMPSAGEGFGIVFLEAMQYRKPIIAANCGATPEVVEHETNGLLVEYGSKAQIASQTIRLCKDEDLRTRMGEAGYERLFAKFSFGHFRDRLNEILLRETSATASAEEEPKPASNSKGNLPKTNPTATRRSKILHVIPAIAEHFGGPSQAIIPMCLALQEQGVDIVLATTNAQLNGGMPPPVLGQVETFKDLPVVFFRKQWGEGFKYSRSFARWLDHHVCDFDVVHIHAVFNHSSIAAARACRQHKVPYIVRPLGTLDPWGMKHKPLRKKVFWHAGVKSLLRDASAIHYTSQAEKESVESSVGLNNGIVIPLGVQLGESGLEDGMNPEKVIPQLANRQYVLVLSRLLPTKGLDELLEAFLSLNNREGFREWRLVLAGSGPADYVNTLKLRAQSRDGSEYVLFPGWLEGNRKQAILGGAALLALPSHHENFGLCVVEALASGVPVLVSPQVNLSSQIELAGAGWIAPVNKDEIERALVDALSNAAERTRRGLAGRELSTQFAWPKISAQLIQLYDSIAKTRV